MIQVIGKIPEFTSDESSTPGSKEETGTEVVEESSTEAAVEETPEEEKVTPSEPPAEEKPSEGGETLPAVSTGELELKKQELQAQISALEFDREKILHELQLARGDRREFKREELLQVEEKLEDLKDINPEDVKTVERILKSRGYVSSSDVKKMSYEAAANDVRDQFMEEHPEYKPLNDPYNAKWNALMAEFEVYRMPDNPRRIRELLERSHKAVAGHLASDRPGQKIEAKKHQVEVASLGSGGGQRSSTSKNLPPEQRRVYEDGGWSEEEIQQIEKQLT